MPLTGSRCQVGTGASGEPRHRLGEQTRRGSATDYRKSGVALITDEHNLRHVSDGCQIVAEVH